MYNWRSKFGNVILRRGIDYAKQKRVTILEHNNGITRALVKGTSSYVVRIDQSRANTLDMSCTCLYAMDGYNCKHMAAVLYTVEEMEEKQRKKGRGVIKTVSYVTPFTPPVPKTNDPEHRYKENYVYFDLSRITQNFRIRKDDYEKAMEMVRRGLIRLDSVTTRYDSLSGADAQILVIHGTWLNEKGGNGPIMIQATADNILTDSCTVPDCSKNSGNYYYTSHSFYPGNYYSSQLCAHEVALLLLTEQYLQTHTVGDSTDRGANDFLQRFADVPQTTTELIPVLNNVKLQPRLFYEYGSLKAGFRIGADKMYVLRSFNELEKSYDEHSVYSLGSKSNLDFMTQDFTDEAFAYYQMICDCVRDTPEPAGPGAKKLNTLPLSGSRLDRLFEMNLGKTLDYSEQPSDYNSVPAVQLTDRDFHIALQIEPVTRKEGYFEGVQVHADLPHIFKGVSRYYCISGKRFCRYSEEASRALAPLFSSAKNGSIDFTIGRNRLAQFYHHVLPRIAPYVDINDTTTAIMPRYLPPKPLYSFYLDTEGSEVTCEARVSYEGESFLVPQHPDPRYLSPSYRDAEGEGRTASYLNSLFPFYDAARDLYTCGKNDDAVYELLQNGLSRLMSMGEVHTTDRFLNLKIRRRSAIRVGVSVESDLMNLDVISEDLGAEELAAILDSYKRKRRFHRLKNGDFLSLEDENIELLSELMRTMNVAPRDFIKGKIQIPVYRALYLDKMMEEHDSIPFMADQSFKQLTDRFETALSNVYEPPASLQDVLRGYQKEGFQWLMRLKDCGFGGILADDMGLGKTVQIISVLLKEKESGAKGTSLIVCPASLVYNWKEEFNRFAPSLLVAAVTGTKDHRMQILKDADAFDVLITSYDLLKRDVDEYENREFLYHVIDEAQYIKNAGSGAAKSVKILHSAHRFALTGTPIENRLSELWSIFDFLMPGFLYSYETFRREMEAPIAIEKDEDAVRRLRNMAGPFILRRLKKDVLTDLPDKNEETIYTAFEEKQLRLYDAQVVRMRDTLQGESEESFRQDKIRIISELTKLRQICCDPSLLFENYTGPSAKRDTLSFLLDTAIEGGHKVLVFSQFTTMLELLQKDLAKRDIPYYVLTGSTPSAERISLVNSFNNDDTPVFFISLKAGGTGLNLIGADTVIHYDPWWNQAAQDQATDRAYRIGQTKDVAVYKLIVKDTIEEKIQKMQEAKKDLADQIISSDAASLTSLTKEELLDLLS